MFSMLRHAWSGATAHNDCVQPHETRLVRRTMFIALLLVSGSLLSSSAIELYVRYRESLENLRVGQQVIAENAALRVQQFIDAIYDRLQDATHTPDILTVGLTAAYRFQLLKLLRRAPAITTAIAVDQTGHELLKVSRENLVLPEDLANHAGDVGVRQAQAGTVFFSPVYFVRQSEPYMRVAVPIARLPGEVIGVLLAEVNLTAIWHVINQIQVGQTGYAYVVSSRGDLIAHPDMSAVLQQQNLVYLPHVQTAVTQGAVVRHVQQNMLGHDVFVTSAPVAMLGWTVVVERPVTEAYAPLYASVVRTLILFVLTLGITVCVSRMLRTRVVRPLAHLHDGAVRIGAGDLAYRVTLTTQDEFQHVADAFNRMAAQLQTVYDGLEQEVDTRTRALEAQRQQLVLANAHKSQFLANMSHELRTPLNAILGYTELILDEIYGVVPQTINDVLQRVQLSGRHLRSLINDVLDIAKMEAGQWTLALADYTMVDVIRTVVAAVEGLAHEKSLALTVTMPEDLPVGTGDAQRLVQVLMNLVGNAIKFTDVGEVRITVTVEAEVFMVAVSDTGSGIAVADQEMIFEQFQQVDSVRTRLQGGTGLGLAIVKRIVAMHGGQVGVDSCLGHGATFWVTLPIRVDHQQEGV